MKFPVKFIIGAALFVAGVVGLVFCFLPRYSAMEQVVVDYVSAVDSGDLEAMADCTSSGAASDFLADSGSDLLEEFGVSEDALEIGSELLDEMQPETEPEIEEDEVTAALRASVIPFPSEATKIQSVELIGCTAGETQSEFGISGSDVTALVRITYLNEAEEEQSRVVEKNFPVMEIQGKYTLAY